MVREHPVVIQNHAWCLDPLRQRREAAHCGDHLFDPGVDIGMAGAAFDRDAGDRAVTEDHDADHRDAMPPGQNNPTIRLAATKVDQRKLPVLSAPLAGQRYIAADGCCDAVRHTRAILPINGQTFVSQRYAIDGMGERDHAWGEHDWWRSPWQRPRSSSP